jgi:thiamine-monophosphate kinase
MRSGKRVASEEALIQRYLAPLARDFPGAWGLGDDCASLEPQPGEEFVLTTDAIAAGVHFLADDAPANIAWKALAVNVSDLAGKGARPIAYLMALAFPEAPEGAWLEKFAHGLAAAQARFAICLAGGDTDRRRGPLAITITAIGSVPKGRMVRRATARPGDKLFVSGTLGDAALGLKLRKRPALAKAWGIGAREARFLLDRYLRPEPQLALREALLGFASAAMDISDGLAKDLDRLARASGLKARVHGTDLPQSATMSKVLARKPRLLTDLVTGGDDYEILAAAAPAKSQGFLSAAAAAGVPLTEIGVLEAGTGIEISGVDGAPLRLERLGWDHFNNAATVR